MKDNQLTQAELQFLVHLLGLGINDQESYVEGVKYKVKYFSESMENPDWDRAYVFKKWSEMKKLYKSCKKTSNKMAEIQRKLKRQLGNP